MIQGNVNGLSKIVIAELESLDLKVPKDIFCTPELVEILSRLTFDINREFPYILGGEEISWTFL